VSGRVVMLATDHPATRAMYHALARRFDVAAVVLEEPVPTTRLLQRRVKKLGLPTVAGQVGFQALSKLALARAARGRIEQVLAAAGLHTSPIDATVVRHVGSANDPATLELLRAARPGAIVVNGTRILSDALIRGVGCPMINVHAGITPRYRGVHGGYWALAEGRPELCGVTVHLIDAGIDTGAVLAQARIEPGPEDSFVTYPFLQLAAAVPLLERAVTEGLAGTLHPVAPMDTSSKLFSHPTLPGYLWRRLTRGVR
jgi:methionyl-tRNA formyltransferase